MDILTAEEVDVAAKADLNTDTKKLYRNLDDCLTDREKEIIILRYGLAGKPVTQKKIASHLGISRSYVSRIEKKALSKLGKSFQIKR